MRILRRRAARTDSNDIAIHTALHAHGAVTTVVSAVALVFSAYSLWETSLKQADLSVYVPGVVTYARDTTTSLNLMPSGGFEVLAVPVTIANSGARDAPVLALQLDVKNLQTGLTARFEAAYTTEPSYFNPDPKAERQKTPFSALVIAGRSAWRGTVLFYPVSYSNGKALTPLTRVREFNEQLRAKYATEMGGASSISVLRDKLPNLPELAELDAYSAKVVEPNGKAEITLKLVNPVPSSWLDRVLDAPARPITLTLEAPNFGPRSAESGELVRVRTVAAGS